MTKPERYLFVTPRTNKDAILALSSRVRIDILELLSRRELNVNEIAAALGLPQSTVATNISPLEKAGLVVARLANAKKGNQKICRAVYEEIVVRFAPDESKDDESLETEMPIGLYTNFSVAAPCGLCSAEGIIGFLDVPGSFLNPDRMKAGLLWFETGWVEYQYPNNSLYKEAPLRALELSVELSSEAPGTAAEWKSDITLWINNVEIGSWTAPGDFGDKRGKYTPEWWKLEGSQYGLLKKWIVAENGSFVDGVRISDVALSDLRLPDHHSIRVRLGVRENADRAGGVNIFGKGFGNHDQALVLRLRF